MTTTVGNPSDNTGSQNAARCAADDDAMGKLHGGSHDDNIARTFAQVRKEVEIIGHYSNTPSLLPDLRRTLDAVTTMVVEDDQPGYLQDASAGRAWKVKDRLSSSEIEQLIESFRQGVTIRELVARYGISRTSVGAVLRQHGARRHPKRGRLS